VKTLALKAEPILNGTPVAPTGVPGLWVKREDLCCPLPGPPFAKMRGVLEHVRNRPEALIGVLDTAHSQGGWAVAYACALTGKRCLDFYPVRKAEALDPLKVQQQAAQDLGARLISLPATASWHLYHIARKRTEEAGGYMMPNALKLPETVESVAAEVGRTRTAQFRTVVVSASSGTIAAGVLKGLAAKPGRQPYIYIHMGYARPEGAVRAYLREMSGLEDLDNVKIVNEGYAYKDTYRNPEGYAFPFPSNPYYDGKAWIWMRRVAATLQKPALLWNIG
jgi:hypothetical protein